MQFVDWIDVGEWLGMYVWFIYGELVNGINYNGMLIVNHTFIIGMLESMFD